MVTCDNKKKTSLESGLLFCCFCRIVIVVVVVDVVPVVITVAVVDFFIRWRDTDQKLSTHRKSNLDTHYTVDCLKNINWTFQYTME